MIHVTEAKYDHAAITEIRKLPLIICYIKEKFHYTCKHVCLLMTKEESIMQPINKSF